jgi:ribosomal peptide maturation radical SAM protein 1
MTAETVPATERFIDYVPRGDALIVVPPFAGLDRPALGAHVLQACAGAAGFEVRVLYSNMLLAARIGEVEYSTICFGSTADLLGERFFAAAAYEVGNQVHGGKPVDGSQRQPPSKLREALPLERFAELAAGAGEWADAVSAAIATAGFPVVGFTSTFEQTAASLALLSRLKAIAPGTVLIMGGANCEGAMAEGIRSLEMGVDYVFSGESERTFPAFLEQIAHGDRPEEPAVYGTPCRTLDAIPTPDFSEYYEQLDAFLPESVLAANGNIWLPYESSRGCWWGEKTHCTFCGINGGGMVFRQKSPDRVIEELQGLTEKHPTNLVCMVDNIMPHQYFKTLLPRLADEVPGLHLFYEQKANLTLERVAALRNAGVGVIQPGIEALSTPLLKLMKKGVTAHQNIALLRYARTVDLAINWNLLYAFPGDRREWYEDTLELIPLLSHLSPPTGLCHLSIDRFSPYFELAGEFDIRNVRPMKAYFDVLPDHADHQNVAYHFGGDYTSESRDDASLVARLEEAIAVWQDRWEQSDDGLPALEVTQIDEDVFLLADTRGLADLLEFEFITRAQAELILKGSISGAEAEVDWALERLACVRLDDRVVPLATADYELLAELERRPTPSSFELEAVVG